MRNIFELRKAGLILVVEEQQKSLFHLRLYWKVEQDEKKMYFVALIIHVKFQFKILNYKNIWEEKNTPESPRH